MAGDDIQKCFGARVQALRRERKLSQEALASRIGTSAETVSNVERGTTWPRPATIMAIADALSVGVVELMGEPQPPKREHPLIEEIVAALSGKEPALLQAVLEQTRILLRISSGKA